MLFKFYKLILFTLIFSAKLFAQSDFEWTPEYRLSLSDFKSPATNFAASIISVQCGSRIDFAYQMSNYEFMFTKNFNDKVVCKLFQEAASIQAPDSATALQLLALAQYDFDLGELYARKLRKKIFEEKSAFSSAQFFVPIFNELEKERIVTFNNAVNKTQFGKDAEALGELHTAVLQQITALSDFCKNCRPAKKKRH